MRTHASAEYLLATHMTEQTIYTLLAAFFGFISAVFLVLALPLHHKQKWWPYQKRTGVTTKNMLIQQFLNQHNTQLARYFVSYQQLRNELNGSYAKSREKECRARPKA